MQAEKKREKIKAQNEKKQSIFLTFFVLHPSQAWYFVGVQSKQDSINVRLDPNLKVRAESVAQACGTSLSMIIRMLLERLVDYSDRHGGKVVMPPEFIDYDIVPRAPGKPHKRERKAERSRCNEQ